MYRNLKPGHTCVDQPNQRCAVPECTHLNELSTASQTDPESTTSADKSVTVAQH